MYVTRFEGGEDLRQVRAGVVYGEVLIQPIILSKPSQIETYGGYSYLLLFTGD